MEYEYKIRSRFKAFPSGRFFTAFRMTDMPVIGIVIQLRKDDNL